MRPLSLSFEHFGSYRSRQDIDFSALDDFFLIYGKTGSGKTTIFDAIAYALYGEALGGRSNLERELASRFSPAGSKPWVEYTFSTVDARWKVYRTLPYRKRNRKGNESEAASEVALYRMNDSGIYELLTDRLSEANEKLLKLLRLSADEFSKIVLLPQGAFQDFLEMKTTERVDILEKLFDVKIYDQVTEAARRKVMELDSSLKAKREERERISAELGEHPESRIETAETAIREVDVNIENAAKEAANLEVEIERKRERLEFWHQLSDSWNAFAEVERSKSAIGQRARRLAAAKALAALENPARQIQTQHAELTSLLQKALRAGTELARLETEREAVEAAEKSLPELNEKRGVLQRRIALLQSAAEAWKQKSELERGLGDITLRLKASSDDCSRRELELASIKDEIAALEVSASGEPAAQEGLARSMMAGEALRRIGGMIEQAEKFEAERQKILRKISGTEDLLTHLARDISASEAHRSSLEEEFRSAHAGLLAASLVQGQPCPVCGSIEHPMPAHLSSSVPDEEALKRASADVEAKKARQAALLQSVNGDTGRTEEIAAELASLLNVATEEWKVYAGIAGLDSAPPQYAEFLVALQNANAAHEALRRKLEVEAAQYRAAREALSKKRKLLDEGERGYASAGQRKTEVEIARADIEARLASLARQTGAEDPEVPLAEARGRLAATELEIQQIERRVRDWQVSNGSVCAEMDIHLSAITAETNSLRGALSRFLDAASSADARHLAEEAGYANAAPPDTSREEISLQASLGGLAKMLPRSGRWQSGSSRLFEDERLLSELLASRAMTESQAMGLAAVVLRSMWPQDRIADEEQAVLQFRESYAKAQASYEVLASRAMSYRHVAQPSSLSQPFDFEGESRALGEACSALAFRKEEIAAVSVELRGRRAALGADLERLRHLVVRREELSREYEAGADEFGKKDMLARLLSGSLNPQRKMPFKNYVLGLQFREIASRASERLYRMSSGRYIVEADILSGGGNKKIGLELFIIDAWNGAKRPVGTLSGGEKFMLSISLALGLADSIQERAGANRIESLFIDEGFGSLDEESLSLAVSVLDELRGDKKIAIISHVEELYNRIPSRIVVKKGVGGSRLEIERD